MTKLLFLLALLFMPAVAHADMAIVATVNDEAISSSDLEGRVRLALLGSGIKPNEETLGRLREQVLRSLIDERLQTQEAKRLGIDVDEKMVDEEVSKLAQQNRQTLQTLPAFFARNGVPISALREQIRASIAWAMVVQRKLRPQVNITDSDVDAEFSRRAAAAGQQEYLAAEIFLPVQGSAQDAAVRQAALRLIDQMARGIRFSAVARQFSQAPSAARGGDLGWVRAGQLEPELDDALRSISPGALTPPVRTANGYYILMLREQRVITASRAGPSGPATLDLRQVLLPVAKSAAATEVTAASVRLKDYAAQSKSCTDMERIAQDLGDRRKGNLGRVKLADLPSAVQALLVNLPDSTPSAPLRNDRGVLYLMICGREAAQTATNEDRKEISTRLGTERLDLLARRYLRDLRQDAFVDIRR